MFVKIGILFGDAMIGIFGARKGAAFTAGNVIPFARGGIISKPTVFPMASGAGLMGEAGPEAVIPLKRHRGGGLGVAGGVNVNMTVYAQDASSFKSSKSQIFGELHRAVSRGTRSV
jgi:lambda family phage tail tape measure protein